MTSLPPEPYFVRSATRAFGTLPAEPPELASHLRLQIVLQPDLVDQPELLFQPVGVILFGVGQHVFEDLAARGFGRVRRRVIGFRQRGDSSG